MNFRHFLYLSESPGKSSTDFYEKESHHEGEFPNKGIR